MIGTSLGLARAGDADAIARLSRDFIEYGLDWTWQAPRVLRNIRDPATNVIVSREARGLSGFAVMKYGDEEAHLLLLAVHPARRRRGVGTKLIGWLEETVRTAGIGVVRLETRGGNAAARRFYGKLGYREVARVAGMYDGVEDGVRLAKDLWSGL
jgi:[ribosomal protein S18]-alanine N-acetyltransferase